MYARLNHIGVCTSYTATQNSVTKIGERMQSPTMEWATKGILFKFVDDNVDKHKGVRDIRADYHGKLIHMYSLLAIKSRVTLMGVSSNATLANLNPSSFLPTEQDVKSIQLNLTVMISRILCQYVSFLAPLKGIVPMHILHEHYEEMCDKSDTFFLDVLIKNEAKHEDMIHIMQQEQKYIGKGYRGKVLSGGDQLTCERQVCAMRHVICGNTKEECLQLLEPTIEDWHTLMCFLSVLWKRLHKNSHRDHGTFGHLCSTLNRFYSSKDPKKDMNLCSDSVFIALKGHYVACACKILGIAKPTDTPSHLSLNGMCQDEKMILIIAIARQVMETFSIIPEALLFQDIKNTEDGVYNYARVFSHYASLALEFKDAWMEGDGERICRCWKVFMLHFQSNGRRKYAWAALRQQFQLINLPPHLAFQLKWGRFVNVHGGKGKNIPCDQYNEHQNKLFKEIIRSMGANMTDKSITRAARSVSTLQRIREEYDLQSDVPTPTSKHSTKDDQHDVHTVSSVLTTNKILDIIPKRSHFHFPKFTANPLPHLDNKKITTWIGKKKKEMLSYTIASGEGDLSDMSASDNDTESECEDELA